MFLYIVLAFTWIDFINTAPLIENDLNKASRSQSEHGEHFEGDMILTPEQIVNLVSALNSMETLTSKQIAAIASGLNINETLTPDRIADFASVLKSNEALSSDQIAAIALMLKTIVITRNGIRDVNTRWPDQTVVYFIEENEFDADQMEMIRAGMESISNNSCINFRARENETEHAVRIQGSEAGCYSNVGYDNSTVIQSLNLAAGCFNRGTIVHEMLHTIGFYHMQSTYNRDDYIRIVWENIKEGKEHNFLKYTNLTVSDFGVAYDYGSVMHYSATAFSKDGSDTIIPLEEGVEIGQRKGLSEKDILKLNRMYNCEDSI